PDADAAGEDRQTVDAPAGRTAQAVDYPGSQVVHPLGLRRAPAAARAHRGRPEMDTEPNRRVHSRPTGSRGHAAVARGGQGHVDPAASSGPDRAAADAW